MKYFEPKSVSEALSLLNKYGERARVVAGGTDVLVDMRFKDEPPCLINLKRIPDMSYIKEQNGSLLIGPLTTIREIETNRLVKERFPVLWGASHQFASLQIRNTATIGGNVCRASPAGEMLAPLLVMEAKVRMTLPKEEKSIALDSFFIGPSKTVLGAQGLVTEIGIPRPPGESGGVYLKHAVRGAMDIAMVGVAILVTPDSTRRLVRDVRIGLGAVAPTPIRARKAEEHLRGKAFDDELIREAAKTAASESKPVTDHRGSAEYRTWIVEALTRRGLTEAWQVATGKEAS